MNRGGDRLPVSKALPSAGSLGAPGRAAIVARALTNRKVFITLIMWDFCGAQATWSMLR